MFDFNKRVTRVSIAREVVRFLRGESFCAIVIAIMWRERRKIGGRVIGKDVLSDALT